MRKIQFTAVLWTLLIAIPLTVLALTTTAYITDHLIQISTVIATWTQATVAVGIDWLFQSEVVGMISGLILILAIAFITVLTQSKDKSGTESAKMSK